MNTSNKYVTLTQDLFDKKVINETKPSVLVFGAEWSGSSEMMNQMVRRVSGEEGAISINYFQVDIEDLPSIANFFGVNIVPTIIFIKKGEVVNKTQGLLSASKLRKLIGSVFLKNSVH